MTLLPGRFTGLDYAVTNRLAANGDRKIDPVSYPDPRNRETDSGMVSEAQKEYDMKLMQMFIAAVKYTQEPAPITINNISASQSEATQKMEAAAQRQTPSRPSMEVISEMFHTFFASGFNRVCFFGVCGMGMYIYWSYLDHKWHRAEVQRRIDSNIVLKMSQWMFNDNPILPRTAPAPAKWFPSFY